MRTTVMIKVLVAAMALTWSLSATAAEVPHRVNLQSIVYDANGNVTTSDSVNLTIRILDEDNNVLFTETHGGVPVVEGAINVSVGGGDGSNGIPMDAIDPSSGTRLIDVQVDGSSPFELMPLGAVPYAMWSEKALTVANDSVGSEQIKNGSIKAEDIDPLAFSDIQGQAAEAQIPASVATDAELAAHVNSTTAHPASAIVVSGSFITFVADDAQEAFQKLDQKLADEIYNRQNMNINSLPGILNESKIDGVIARDAEVAAAVASHAAMSIDTAHSNGSLPSSRVSGLGTLATLNAVSGGLGGTITDDTITGDDVKDGSLTGDDLAPGSIGTGQLDLTALDGRYVNTMGGDTMAGPLQVNGNLGTTGTISSNGGTMTGPLVVPDPGPPADTFDVGVELRDHKNRIGALEGANQPQTKTLTLRWVTNVNNASGGQITGADDASWSLSGVNTGDGKWVSITRSSITVPSGCVAMANGTVSPDVTDGEVSSQDYDDPAFLKITYSGVGETTVNLKVYGLGNDGEYDIAIRIVALPTDPSVDCTIP